AIDAGSDNIPGVTVPTTDQRGARRGPAGLNAGSTVDIGAYEASSSYLVTSTAPSTDVGTLQTAIDWASISTNANPAAATSPAPNTIVVAAAGDYVLAAPDLQSLDSDLAGISNAVVTAGSPVSITIDLSPNTAYQNVDDNGHTVPIDATAPAGVALTLNGPPSGTATLYDLVTSGTVTVQGNITVIGNSPALVVNSGLATIANEVTLVTATSAPTIQVNGGTLVVRDSTVEQDSTTSSQPAILVDGGSVNLGSAASPGGNTLDVNGTGPLIEDTTGSPVSAAGDTFESNGKTVTSSFGNVNLSAPASQTANQGAPQPFNLGSLTDTVTDSQSWALDVNWGDNSAHTDYSATSTGPLGPQSHAFALPGTYTVTVTATDPVTGGATAWDLVQSFTVTVAPSIFVLDSSAGGSLSLSGNASLKIPGAIVVDSSSPSALTASGNAQIKASVIEVHGGVQKSGNASFSPAPSTGAAVLPDPLASLAEPSTSGLTSYPSVSLSGNSSATIKPGIYSQIIDSGNGTLTLTSGLYIIEGGGFSVSGNASVSGSGVTIFNAGSKYPTTGGTYGSITFSGNGSYNLSPPTSGTYAGIVIFQSRDNSKAVTLSGNAQLNAAVVVDTMTISGNGVSNTVALSSPVGTVAYSPAQIRSAYGISSLAYDGTGQTIAIVDAYDDPSIFQALDAFDTQFGLTTSGPTLYQQYGPASSFLTVLNQYGQATSLPSTDPSGPGTDNWEVEEALDVEWTHAIAPGAQIILVEANSQSLSDLMAGVATAAAQPGVSVVSMSWGFPEGQAVFAGDEAAYANVFNVAGLTFVASTGDYGAADPEYPAYSPNVVAVGGTSLTLNGDGSYNSETGWGYDSSSAGTFIGSGGGISLYEPEPSFQQGVQSTGYRTTPDVSMVADPA
ncbi:MAG TPA: S53 family peptidase, partial [Chloroflexota bacterium]|nr:S53 family peptidase [Chloroflexota bacterium]